MFVFNKQRCVLVGVVTVIIVLSGFLYVYSVTPLRQSDTSKRYICQTFNGRLGNHVFQYASVYGIARLNNHTVILGQNDAIAKYFRVPTAEIRPDHSVCKSFKRVIAANCCMYEENMTRLDKRENYVLGLYLQSWRYFGHVMEEVRRELEFNDVIMTSAEYIVENYRAAYSATGGSSAPAVVVGVHIRRGDLLTNPKVYKSGPQPAPDHYFPKATDIRLYIVTRGSATRENKASDVHLVGPQPAPDHYFPKATDFFLRQYSNVVFLVCTDDVDYSGRLFGRLGLRAHVIHTSPVQDMAILASCDHVIITHGSFGWWGAFLSNGTVVYYKYPVREGSGVRTEYNYEDYFPPTWIGLE